MIKSVIMAGGEGTRLRPITCTIPKPLVPIMNRPVIDYCIELLKRHNITDITTTLFYLGNQVTQHLQSGEGFGVNIKHSKSTSPLGTAGSVKLAVKGTTDTIVVISGDTLTDCDLTSAIEYHRSKRAKATIVLKKVSVPNEYGVALLNGDGKITRFFEKPSQSEVFSDLANTGIYILEPEVLDYIPDDRAFDFSMDLFPALLQKGMGVYGYEMQGYWCDIGNIKQYMQAQRDLFERRLDFNVQTQCKNGIYAEQSAKISDNARISAPCYIGENCEIGENVSIDAYSVIGSNSRICANTSIKRSVVFDNAYVDESCELRGAIICKDAKVGRESKIFEGSVIGEGSVVGNSCIVSAGSSLWPDKHIKDNMTITDNVVWGIGKRAALDNNGISGCIVAETSPETAVRIGASFARLLSSNGQIAIAGDGKRVTSMLKRAATSGVISQGIDVMSLPYMPFFLFSFTVRHLGLAGGIYITTSQSDPHQAMLIVCDHTGTAIQTSLRRKLDHEFSWGEHRPVAYREIGIVEELTGSVKAYEAELTKNVNNGLFTKNQVNVLLDIPSNVYSIAAPILMRLGINVLSANTDDGMNMQARLEANNADFGVYMTESNDLTMPYFMLRNGKTIGGMALIAILAKSARETGTASRFTVPVTFPDEYSRMLMDIGVQLITAPENIHLWQRAAYMNKTEYTAFFDPIAAIIQMCALKASNRLTDIIESLPKTFKQESIVECKDFGKALRSLAENEAITISDDAELVDGIKLHKDNGWVIVKAADGGLSACRIICGSFKEEYANELCDMYVDKMRKMK